ncbi:hypothetical protein CsatA_024173 [Cannabis sativa]
MMNSLHASPSDPCCKFNFYCHKVCVFIYFGLLYNEITATYDAKVLNVMIL